MNITVKSFLLVFLICNASHAATWFVGIDNNECHFSDIQAAIDASSSGDEIRIASSGSPYINAFALPFQITHSLSIVGGYETCSDANNDIENNTMPEISSGDLTMDAFVVDNGGVPAEYSFENLVVSNSDTGILLLAVNATFSLSNVHFSENNMGMNSTTTSGIDVNVDNSLFEANSDGAILCVSGDSSFNLTNSEIKNHHISSATGVSALTFLAGCDVNIEYSVIQENSFPGNGGALNLQGGSSVNLTHVLFKNNQADSDLNGSGTGGALYANDNVNIEARATCFENNLASRGGAMALYGGSTITARRDVDNTGCHQYKGNTAQFSGGVIYMEGTSTTANLVDPIITENRANSAVVGDLEVGADLTLTNALITSNGDNGSNNFNDLNLFESGVQGQGGSLELQYSTIADNLVTGVTFNNGLFSSVRVSSSIISESNGNIYQAADPSVGIFECLIAHEDQSYNGVPGTILVADPLFENRTNGNYRLSSVSPAIDFCYQPQSLAGINTDYEADSRGVDHPEVTDNLGPYDLGFDAFDHLRLFRNGFNLCEI